MSDSEENVILKLFEEKKFLKICAPMVRYSKLPFRNLVRAYDTDLCFTPMIMSDSFSRSAKARDNEFTTNTQDRPLIVQFAANDVREFVDSALVVQNVSDGVDLNCGCPQRWALKEGIGACLINNPAFVSDLVSSTRRRCRNGLCVSVKIRIHDDIRKSVDFCRQMERAGVDFITVHGRTREQRSDPVNWEAVTAIRESVSVPIVANGDIKSLEDAEEIRARTGVSGVMAARGMLENPAMFSGHSETPRECVEKWCRISLETGTSFSSFHHHLIYMMEKSISKSDRKRFNGLGSTAAVLDFLETNYNFNFT